MTGNAAGLERTLKALRLGEDMEALVAAGRALAEAVDDEPADAALWNQYRLTVLKLMEAGQVGDDDETAGFLHAVQTKMGHAS